MNGYLFGLALILAWLSLQMVGGHVRHKALMKAFSVFTEMLGAMAEMPEEKVKEALEHWDCAKVNADRSLTVSSCILLAVLVFLTVLVVRGHL